MFKQLLSVFLESRCEFCQRPTTDTLCTYCWQKLSSHQLSKSDRLKLESEQAIFAWGKYDGELKRAIALMKYDHKPDIGKVLGNLLGQTWLESKLVKLQSKVTVVPIPLHSTRQKERGFNQAEVIAQSFCQITGCHLNTQALTRIRQTEAMFNLPKLAARANNIQGALQIGAKLPKHPVLLVDDIHTTGTTVQEAIKILQQNQVQVIGVAVAAKAGK